jgi:hypothetical protein
VCGWVIVCFIEYKGGKRVKKKRKEKKGKMEFLFHVTLT